VGSDPSCEYSGASVVLNPYGVVIAECERGVECAATADVDIESLSEFRAKFPVLNDADNFCLEQ
jgi:predicted amidohydrolase